MKAVLALYWRRLFVTELDTTRASRSFWLQFASARFPDIKNAEELIGVSDKFFGWHWHGEMPAQGDAQGDAQVVKLRVAE